MPVDQGGLSLVDFGMRLTLGLEAPSLIAAASVLNCSRSKA
jgi:hypothetical protein